MIDGKASMQQFLEFLTAFSAVSDTSGNQQDGQKVVRFLDRGSSRLERKGRDEKRRLAPVEQTGNIVDLFKRMDMSDEDYENWRKSQKGGKRCHFHLTS